MSDQIYIKVPFALNGDQTVIPETDATGAANFNDGYGIKYSQDPNTTGLSLDRAQMNYLLYLLSLNIKQLQEHGVPLFITTADNGGVPFPYDKHAVVLYDAGSGLQPYQSLITANASLPTDASKWRALDPYNRLIERDSPAFTGNPTAPTQTQGDNSTKLATTAYADQAVADLLASYRPYKAKIVFNNDDGGINPIVLDSYNVSSIVRYGNNAGQGQRRYRINFTTPMPNTSYAVVGGNTATSGGVNCAVWASGGPDSSPTNKTVNYVEVVFGTGNGDGVWVGEGSVLIF